MTLPDTAFCAHDGRGFRLLVTADYETGALELDLERKRGCDAALARARRVPGGRSTNLLLEANAWSHRVRLRPAQRGGWLGRYLGDRFIGPNRPRRELALWQGLLDRGAALPEPVLALSQRRGLFWRHYFGAVQLDDALDGAAWLERPRKPNELARAIALLARTLRAFHDLGGIHGDLQLRNLLLEGEGNELRCWLIDLDRSRQLDRVSPIARMRELMRLARSLEKTGRHDLLTPRLRAIFLRGYCGDDRSMRRALQAASPREIRRLARHRLGWRLRRFWTRGTAASLVLATLTCTVGCTPDGESLAGISQDEPPRLSLLAVGDTGRTRRFPPLFEGQRAVANSMSREDARAPVDALVLLGDNFYWHGLDREHLVERIRENLVRPYCRFLRLTGPRSPEVRDACEIDPARRHPIPIHAVLGNHDLELPESARLQREVIREFLPDWNMSDGLAEVVELGQGVSLILFESEIAIDDAAAIRRALIQAVRRARGPWRILATHRPIATDDLGGVPVGGYPGFVRNALGAAGAPVQLVLAAHHHSLQAFELTTPSALLQVGLGSGSRAEPPLAHDDHPDVRFSALELGFGRVDLRGAGDDERLVVSLYGTASWPWLAAWRDHRRLARFEVDRAGRVTQTLTD